VTAYYYLVIFEGRHGGAIRKELRRVFDGALRHANLGAARAHAADSAQAHTKPGLSQANRPLTQCHCGFPKRARERNTMDAVSGQVHRVHIGEFANGSA
jgi:hypothetical protein